MVWGVSAAVHAEPESALSAEAQEEFRPARGRVVGARYAAGGPETQNPLLPRRRPVPALAGGTQGAVVALGEPPEGATKSGAIASRPDLNLLAQVSAACSAWPRARPGQASPSCSDFPGMPGDKGNKDAADGKGVTVNRRRTFPS